LPVPTLKTRKGKPGSSGAFVFQEIVMAIGAFNYSLGAAAKERAEQQLPKAAPLPNRKSLAMKENWRKRREAQAKATAEE